MADGKDSNNVDYEEIRKIMSQELKRSERICNARFCRIEDDHKKINNTLYGENRDGGIVKTVTQVRALWAAVVLIPAAVIMLFEFFKYKA